MKYFETVRCFEGEALHVEFHNQRVARTICKNIELNEFIYPPNDELTRCKIIYNKDEILSVEYHPYEVSVPKVFKVVEAPLVEYSKKYLERDCLDSLVVGCDEVIITQNGLITDTSKANIALLIDGVWRTPKKPLLYGTTLARLSENLKFCDLHVEDLKRASKIGLMNAMVEFVKIDDHFII